MIGTKRTLVSALVSVLLVATAVTASWLMASAGVFSGVEKPLMGAPESSSGPTLEVASGGGGLEISTGFQVSQPRDPFEPLIDPGPTTTSVGGESPPTTSGDGATTTTTPADGSVTTTTVAATTTTAGDSPDGVRVALLEVREENGALVAVLEVDGQTHTVGVGDTFAETFKVVSLTETGGVFTFGDSAFTLAVGQSIFK